MRNLYLLLAATALCAGCVSQPSAVDAGFGQAVLGARAAQVINPNAPARQRAPATADGQAAKSAVERYQKSFDAPPPPVNVLNIGVGSSSGTQ